RASSSPPFMVPTIMLPLSVKQMPPNMRISPPCGCPPISARMRSASSSLSVGLRGAFIRPGTMAGTFCYRNSRYLKRMERTERKKPGPVIILVEPQLGENIGMVARAMANFGLEELRLVNPRDGWPNDKARAAASKADHVIDGVSVFTDLEAAVADLNFVIATTA